MRAVVVAKTQMGQNICVGAVAEESGELLRLIPAEAAEYHSWRRFDADVGSIIIVEGSSARDVVPPHVEDYLVKRYRRTGKRKSNLERWIRNNCEVWIGPRTTLFGGCLRYRTNGRGYLSRAGEVPENSVGFWELPNDLRKQEINNRVRYSYSGRLCVDVPFVGTGSGSHPDTIVKGTLARMSLSRWFKPEGAEEAKCWLQLSGYY